MTDNRYGVFKYGTSRKYGATTYPLNDALGWVIEVDWNGDGAFDGINEAAYLMSAPRIVRGRRTMLRPSGQGFEPVRTGQATITLSNHDGRYDAWNTSSPLYPNVEAGKDIRIRVMDLNTGTVYPRFYGIVQEIEPVGYGTEAKVIIHAEDAMRVLRDTYVTVNRTYSDGTFAPEDIRLLVIQILNAMQWSWSYHQGNRTYDVRYWYASGDRSAGAELEDLALSFFGYLCIDNLGRLHHLTKGDNTASVETITQSELRKDIGNPQPWAIRRNVVKLRFHTRRKADDIQVWTSLVDDPAIEAGDTKTSIVEATYNGYPAFVESLETIMYPSLSPNNYEAPPGGGSLTTTSTNYGTRIFLSNVNNWAVPVFLFPWNSTAGIGTYLRGDITWTEKAETISNPRDPSSVANQRALVLDSLWYQDKNQAYDFVDNYQAFVSQSYKTPVIQLENRFALQFTPDLFDVVTVTITPLGISSETFRVGGIEEEPVGETTQGVRTTFYLEPFLSAVTGSDSWGHGTWDTTKWSW